MPNQTDFEKKLKSKKLDRSIFLVGKETNYAIYNISHWTNDTSLHCTEISDPTREMYQVP